MHTSLPHWVNNGGNGALALGLLHLSQPTLVVRIGAAGSCHKRSLTEVVKPAISRVIQARLRLFR
jgi:hypothetical protein